jgi:hypothetical protein
MIALMATGIPKRTHRLTQPEEMKTAAYLYGVEKLNGYDAWALFKACAMGDEPKVQALVAKDRRLVNAQFWYQFPIHMAVRAGHAEIVQLLLDQGADPGQSRFTYNITGIAPRAAGHILPSATPPCWSGACWPEGRNTRSPWRLPWVTRNASNSS